MTTPNAISRCISSRCSVLRPNQRHLLEYQHEMYRVHWLVLKLGGFPGLSATRRLQVLALALARREAEFLYTVLTCLYIISHIDPYHFVTIPNRIHGWT